VSGSVITGQSISRGDRKSPSPNRPTVSMDIFMAMFHSLFALRRREVRRSIGQFNPRRPSVEFEKSLRQVKQEKGTRHRTAEYLGRTLPESPSESGDTSYVEELVFPPCCFPPTTCRPGCRKSLAARRPFLSASMLGATTRDRQA